VALLQAAALTLGVESGVVPALRTVPQAPRPRALEAIDVDRSLPHSVIDSLTSRTRGGWRPVSRHPPLLHIVSKPSGAVEPHSRPMTRHQQQRPESRRARRGIQIGATALIASAAFGFVSHQQVVGADDAPTTPTSSAAAASCDHLWDRVPVSGLPRAAWESAAEGVGLSAQGSWVSADGLSWEHLDGRVIVVATPRTPSTATSQDACSTHGTAGDGERASGSEVRA
jgi:hypothetical protein